MICPLCDEEVVFKWCLNLEGNEWAECTNCGGRTDQQEINDANREALPVVGSDSTQRTSTSFRRKLMTQTNEAVGTTAAQQPGLNREQIQLLKDTICKGSSDAELQLFVEICRRKNLDPFSRQIHPVKRWDSTLRRETMTFQTGIDGFRLVAQRSGKYEGQTKPLWCGPDGKWREVWLDKNPPAAAMVGVYRAGFREPMFATATYAEYVQTKEGGPNSMWRKMPSNQLAKCAEALALPEGIPRVERTLQRGRDGPRPSRQRPTATGGRDEFCRDTRSHLRR
jgi:phage recombination protein Bet